MNVNILGFGVMARQIACLFYLGGFDVNIWNRRVIDISVLDNQVKAMRIFLSLKDQSSGHFQFVSSLSDLPDAFTIETVAEDLSLKRDIFCKVKDLLSKGFYTNSSSYSPWEIGEGVGGLHFFNPIQLRFIEYCEPRNGRTGAARLVLEYLTHRNFEIYHVHANRGYAANFLIFREISNVLKLIEQHRYDVDTLRLLYGKIYGDRNIFDTIDIIGIDTAEKILSSLREEDPSLYVPQVLEKAMKRGILGRKNGTSIMQFLRDQKNER